MAAKILQINLHHSKAASASFCRSFSSGGYDLALIQEPWLHRGRIAGLADARGKVIYSNSVKNPRTCIVVKKGCQCLPLMEFCSRDLTTVETNWSQGDARGLVFSSAYFPYDSREPPPPLELRLLVEKSQGTGRRLIIGCDANAHHQIGWGSSNTNPRGENLMEYLTANNLQIINVGNTPTFENRMRSEVIDITITTANISDCVRGWNVLEQASLSDHKYIQFKLEVSNEQNNYRNPRKTDWACYAEQLTAMTGSLAGRIHSIIDLEHVASSLNEAMIDSFNENCPLQIRKSGTSISWWTADLDRQRKQVRKLFNRAKSCGSWQAYHAGLTKYSKAIRKAKFQSWVKFTGELSGLKETARLCKIMASNPTPLIGSLKKSDNEYTESAGDTLDLLLETHFPGSTQCDRLDSSGHLESGLSLWAARRDWNLANRIITLSRIKWAIGKFSPYKAPGGDGIYPAMLQHASEPVLKLICELCRASVAFSHIPLAWRVSRVVFIPKRGKSDYSQAKSFRPISLSSFLLKTVERLVERYIRDGVLRGEPLHRNQHAYQPGKSCITALSELVSRAEDSLANREIALCAFLDIEGAFDNASHEVIVSKANNRGVPLTLSRWINNMLKTRRVQSTLLNETREISTTRGCPQGGVLSPLLWNLVVDDLLEQVSRTGAFIQGYADDIVLVVQGKFVDTVTDVMNSTLKQVSSWCRKERLRVNPSKTVILPITRIRNLNSLARLELNGVPLKISNCSKYLGITLDRTLTWNLHVQSVVRKANWSLLATRRFIGKTWGLKPHMALWLYKAVIRPQITYASLVWFLKAKQSTVKEKLSSLQRLACLCITGAFSSTPTAALQVLLNLTPLDIFIEMEARKSWYRLSINCLARRGPSFSGHVGALQAASIEPLLNMRSDLMVGEYSFVKPYTISIDSRQQWTTDKSTLSTNNATVWFTDGSLMDGKAGYGAHRINPRCNLSGSLGKFCTVFQAEIFAILSCTQLELAIGTKNKNIFIYSDSQASLRALDSNFINSSIVWECTQALRSLSSKNTVHLEWIPAHMGFKGNEKADLLARKGALSPYTGPEPAVGISLTSVKSFLSDKASSKHALSWMAFPGQELAKTIVKGPSRALTEYLVSLSRQNIKLTVSYITSHGHFRNHLAKMGLHRGNTDCRLCERFQESAKHILMDCDSLEVRRRGLLGGRELQELTPPEVGQLILALCKPTGIGLPI